MIDPALHQGARIDLTSRLRATGFVRFVCDADGAPLDPGPSGEDWLRDLVLLPALARRGLERAAQAWATESVLTPREIATGLWAVAVPRLERRRIAGWSVTAMPAKTLLEAEELHALCDGAALDYAFVRARLAALPPIDPVDVDRTALLVCAAHEDLDRRNADGEAVESIGRELSESYEEVSLLHTLLRSMTKVDRPDRYVAFAAEELLATMSYQWVAVLVVDDPDRLKKLSGRFFVAGDPAMPEDRLRRQVGDLLARAEIEMPMVLRPDENAADRGFSALGSPIVAHPISSDGRVLGIFVAAEKQGGDRQPTSGDVKLLGAAAGHTAIFIENARLYEDLAATFLGTLEALTAAIDAKDKYTCGHSRRVAHLTESLARAIGLDEHAASRAHIAGLVHDVGKIGVPERVLTKPGRLEEEEFAWIRLHPEIGHRIMRDIPQLRDVLPGVLHHHERWDGRGYPHGISGEDIPLVARLIALADSFDAMSSNRTYRKRLSRGEVLAEIRSCAGAQFDPGLVPAFLALDFSEFDRLVEEHEAASHDDVPDAGAAA